ncbi:hypothetical protein [Fibrobacter sp. UWB11]|uniref:hypothetical protein n=1 Tax=Fibrobacter sp. UWB11 TaxID=1896202 RepID=UPI00158809EE|nr:hypothetical protein [Fibrobacter sp. UWB11]
MKLIICMLLVLSLVGCSVSTNPNPMIRYGANTAATMALPGGSWLRMVAVSSML